MPVEVDYDLSYPNRLISIGLELNEPFRGSKQHHSIKCLECGNIFDATPLSKLQNFKKHQLTGCPNCTNKKKYADIRTQNLQKLDDNNLDLLSNWDGISGIGKESKDCQVTVSNRLCGHIFSSRSKNLLNRGVRCPVCAKQLKTANLNKSSKGRSEEWKKTADIWQLYKSKVTRLSKISYKNNKDKINPNNLSFGRAGKEGAHHLDHIVPVRYCFENYIPEELCSHPDNLQILGWRENIGSRDKLKEYVPNIFVDFIRNL